MARVGSGINRRSSSDMVEISDNDRQCLDEFHVLAVDDSFVDRKVIERLLKISSCKVTVVESGKRALQLLGLDEEKGNAGCNGLKVHLIITDYSMPAMTGYELLKKIKESSMFREVPVVIMSSENILTRIHSIMFRHFAALASENKEIHHLQGIVNSHTNMKKKAYPFASLLRCLEEGAKEYLVKPVKLADVKRLKEFMTRDLSNGLKEQSNSNPTLQESRALSFPATRSSSSSPEDINPIILGYPCSSPKCGCNSRRPRFRSRSSKYHSELSLH